MVKILRIVLFFVVILFAGLLQATAQTIYYSAGTATNPAITTWWTNRNGTGSNPAAYNSANIVLVVQNGHTITWSSAITMVSSSVLEVETGGFVNSSVNNTIWLRLGSGGRFNQTGTYTSLNFAASGQSVSGEFIAPSGNFRPLSYPNSLNFNGTTTVNLGNNSLSVSGDLLIPTGMTFAGTSNNNPTITIGGTVIVSGTFTFVASGGTGNPTFNIGGSTNIRTGSPGSIINAGTGAPVINLGSATGDDTLRATTGTSLGGNITFADNQTTVVSVGTLTKNAGILNLGAGSTIDMRGSAISGSGGLTIGNGTTVITDNNNGIKIAAGGCLNLNGTITLGTGLVFRYTNSAVNQATGLLFSGLTSMARIEVATLGGRTVTLDKDITLTDGLIVNTSETFSYASRTLTITGANIVVNGTLTDNATSTLVLSGGNSITLPATKTTYAGALTINQPSNFISYPTSSLTVSGAFTFTAGTFDISGKTLSMGGAININAAANLPMSSATSLAITGSGAISWGPATPSSLTGFTLNRTGATFTFGSDVTFGGTFDFSAGTIDLSTRTVIFNGSFNGNGGTVNLNGSNATLNANISASSGTILGNTSTNFTVANSGSISVGGSVVFPTNLNNFTMNRSTRTFNIPSNTTIGGTFDIQNGTVSLGGMTLTLNGPISVGSNGAFSPASSSNITIANTGTISYLPIVFNNCGTFTMNRAGATFTFNSSNTTFNGGLTVTSGNVVFSGSSAMTVNNLIVNGGTLDISGNGFHMLNSTINIASGTVFTSSSTGLNITGSGTITWSLPFPSVLGDFTMNRPSVTFTIPSDITFGVAFSATAGTVDLSNRTVSNSGSFTLNGGTINYTGATVSLLGAITISSGTMTGTSSTNLSVSGSGTITNSGTNTTPSNLNNFTLNRAGQSFLITGPLTVSGVFTITSGTFNFTAASLTLNGAVSTVAGTSFTSSSTSNLTIGGSGTFVWNGGSPPQFNNFTVNRAGITFTILSNITIAGGLSVTAGTLDLTSRNWTVTGTLTLNGGTLITNNGTPNINGPISITSGTFTANTATSIAIGGTGAISWTIPTPSVLGGFTMGRSSQTFTFNTDVTFSGTFNNNNGTTAFPGITVSFVTFTMAAGTLDLSGTTATFNNAISTTGGTFTGNSSTNLTITGTGTITLTATNTPTSLGNFTMNRATRAFTLRNSCVVSGTFSVQNGTVDMIGSISVSLNGPISVAATGTFTPTSTNNITIGGSGAISYASTTPTAFSSFTMNRTGETFTFNSNPTFSSTLTVTAGTLSLANRTYNTNFLTVNGGTLISTGGSMNVGNAISITSGAYTTDANSSLNITGAGAIVWTLPTPSAILTFSMNRPGVTFALNQNVTFGGTFNGAAGTVDFSNLTVTHNAAFNLNGGTLTYTSATINVNSSITFNSGTLSTTSATNLIIGNTGTITVAGPTVTPANLNNFTMNRSGQTFNLNGPLTVAGALNIAAGGINASGQTVTLNGDVTLSSGTTFTSSTTTNITIGGSGTITWTSGTPTNLGAFTMNRASTTFTFNNGCSFSGAFNITAGTVSFPSLSITFSGAVSVAAGSTLNISGTVTTFGNAVNFDAASTITTSSLTALIFNGSGTTVTWAPAFPTALRSFSYNKASTTFVIPNDLTLSSGNSNVTAGTVDFSNRNINCTGSSNLNVNGGNTNFTGATLTTSAIFFVGSGTCNLSNANVSLNGAITISGGSITTTSNTNLSIGGSGTISVTGGTTPSVLNNFTMSRASQTFTLNGPLTVSGNYSHTNGTIDAGSQTLTLNGNISVGASGIYSSTTSSISIGNTGTISWAATPTSFNNFTMNRTAATFTFNSGSPTFSGNFSATAGTVAFGARTVTHTGNFTVNGGTVDLTGTTSNWNGNIAVTSGTVTTTSATNVSIGSGAGFITYSLTTPTLFSAFTMNRASRTFTFTSNPTFTGAFTATNGTVSFNSRTPVFNGQFAVSSSGSVDFTGATISFNGNINVTGGTLTTTSATNYNIANSGTIVYAITTPAALNNFTMNRAGQTFTFSSNPTISGSFTATNGTVDLSSRTVTFSNQFVVNGGTVNLGSSSVVDFNGPISVSAGSVSATSASNWTIGGSGVISWSNQTPSNLNNLTLNRSGETFALTSPLTISGTLNLSNGTFNASGQNLVLAGDYNRTSGAFTTNSATSFTLNGTGALTSNLSFSALNSLTINRASSTIVNSSPLTVSGTLTLSNGTFSCNDLTLNGPWSITSGVFDNNSLTNLTIGGSGSLPTSWNNNTNLNSLSLDRIGATLTTENNLTILGAYSIINGIHKMNSGTLSLNGDIAFTSGYYLADATSDVNISGSGTVTGSPQFRLARNFTMNRAASTLTLVGINHFTNDFTVTSGTVDIADATLRLGGAFSNSGSLVITSNTSLFFDGSGAVTGLPTGIPFLDSLRINRTGFTMSRTADLSIVGGFELNSGTLDLGSYSLTLSGPISYTGGSINPSATTDLTVDGAGTISGFPPTPQLNNFLFNRDGRTINLSSNTTINGTLDPVAGTIATGTNTITLGSTATLNPESNSGKVSGNIQTTRSVGTGANSFGGLGYQIASGADNLGNVTVLRKSGSGTTVTGDAGETSINTVFSVTITGSQPTSGRVVTLKWLNSDDNGKDFTPNTCDVWRRNTISSPWQKIANDQAITNSIDSRTVQAVTNHFSDYTVSDDVNPLPVDLTYFKANREGGKITLKWETRQERNNKGFRIEQSFDNKTYTKLGFVDGKGNKVGNSTYEYTLYQPKATYFKLIQVDADGTESINGPVFVAQAGQELAMVLYPNPVVDQMVIQGFDGIAQIEIFNAKGQLVKESKIIAGDNIMVGDLAKGLYNCRVTTPAKVWETRFNK